MGLDRALFGAAKPMLHFQLSEICRGDKCKLLYSKTTHAAPKLV